MNLRTNPLKTRLKTGATALVSFIRLSEPGLAEILGYAGLDGVIIDMEHGAMGWTEAERMILAAYAAETTPIVRVARLDPSLITRALDIGALGIIAPHIRCAASARKLLEHALYPPRGNRGVGTGRSAKWGAIPAGEYFPAMNDEVLVGAMIEDREALDELDDIAALGLDLMVVGAADMSASVGELGASSLPKVMAIGDRVIAAGRKHGVAVGFPCRSRESANEAVKRGYRLLALGSAETLLLQHVRELAALVRAEVDAVSRQG